MSHWHTKAFYPYAAKEEHYQGMSISGLEWNRQDTNEAAKNMGEIDPVTGRELDVISMHWYLNDADTIRHEIYRRGQETGTAWIVSGQLLLESGRHSRKHRELATCISEEGALHEQDRQRSRYSGGADKPECLDVLIWTKPAWEANLAKGRSRR